MSELRNPKRWRVVGKEYIQYPGDDDVLAAMLKGDKVPRTERKLVTVLRGDIAEGVPQITIDRVPHWFVEADTEADPYRVVPEATEGEAVVSVSPSKKKKGKAK